jgi:hypothetical protein
VLGLLAFVAKFRHSVVQPAQGTGPSLLCTCSRLQQSLSRDPPGDFVPAERMPGPLKVVVQSLLVLSQDVEIL